MKDIPKSIVIILLVLVVVISILGTWTVLDEIEKSKLSAKSSAAGTVKLQILSNPNQNKQESFGSGKVSLNILEEAE